MNAAPCRFGYVEYDCDQYCFEHGGFRCFYVHGRCDRADVGSDGRTAIARSHGGTP